MRDNKLSNRIIDAITISFGVQNIIPDTLAANTGFIERGKSLVNELLGRTTGLNIFHDGTPEFKQQFSIEGALSNQQTVAGFIALG